MFRGEVSHASLGARVSAQIGGGLHRIDGCLDDMAVASG